MPKFRLHTLEGALELFSAEPFVFRSSELYQIDHQLRSELERYNIYLVARRPRLSLIPSSILVDPKQNIISGVIEAHLRESKEHLVFKASIPNAIQIDSLRDQEYPFDLLRCWAKGNCHLNFRLHDILRLSNKDYSPITDMFVEYVGQAFGEAGERDVIDRLIGNTGKDGHGSLQKVLAEVNANHPDQEVHLLLYSFEFHKRIIFGGGCSGTPEPNYSFSDQSKRFEQFYEAEITRKTRINLAEAAIIKHFAPKYNDKYKRTFPLHTHKILERLHELDITGLHFTLSTKEHNVRLFSQTVPPSDEHCGHYPISKDEDRITFFDLAMSKT